MKFMVFAWESRQNTSVVSSYSFTYAQRSLIRMKRVLSSHTLSICVHSNILYGPGLIHKEIFSLPKLWDLEIGKSIGRACKGMALQIAQCDGSRNCSSFPFADIKFADFPSRQEKTFM